MCTLRRVIFTIVIATISELRELHAEGFRPRASRHHKGLFWCRGDHGSARGRPVSGEDRVREAA